jgi:hypothetical protein
MLVRRRDKTLPLTTEEMDGNLDEIDDRLSSIENLSTTTVSTSAPSGTPSEGEEWIVVSEV